MGDVVPLRPRLGPPRRRGGADAVPPGGEIALFTGVRVERWCERDPERPEGPSGSDPRPPGGRRRRRPETRKAEE